MGNVPGSKNDVSITDAFKVLLENHKGGDIVSVGSGYGVMEKHYSKEFGVTITTIDPLVGDDSSYLESSKPVDMSLAKLPMFATVADYVAYCNKNSESLDGISLILDWPSPNQATYGVEAIASLKSPVILIRYASCGGAGSSKLQAFLRSCNCPSDDSDDENVIVGNYKCVYSLQRVFGSGGGFDGRTIDVVVLVKTPSKSEKRRARKKTLEKQHSGGPP